jgi:hypothetical protein
MPRYRSTWIASPTASSAARIGFLPHYFDGLYLDIGEGGNFAWMGLHLWYLLVLFIFSLAFYPLLRWLKGSGKGALNMLGGFLAFPGAVYLLALPVILLASAVGDTPLGELAPGGWSLVVYSCFFLSGFVITSHEGLQASIRRLRWVSFGMGLVLMAALLFLSINVDHPAIDPSRSRWVIRSTVLAPGGSWPSGFRHAALDLRTPF